VRSIYTALRTVNLRRSTYTLQPYTFSQGITNYHFHLFFLHIYSLQQTITTTPHADAVKQNFTLLFGACLSPNTPFLLLSLSLSPDLRSLHFSLLLEPCTTFLVIQFPSRTACSTASQIRVSAVREVGESMASVNPQPLQYQDPAIPVDDDDDDDSDGADDDAMDELEDAHVSSVNVVANAASANHEPLPAMPSRTSELTLSFEGEVYVFPAVTPQKVIILYNNYL